MKRSERIEKLRDDMTKAVFALMDGRTHPPTYIELARQSFLGAIAIVDEQEKELRRLRSQILSSMGLDAEKIEQAAIDSGMSIDDVFKKAEGL